MKRRDPDGIKLALPEDRMFGDVEILTRTLSDIVSAMLMREPGRIFAALQRMKVYCERLQSEMWRKE